ncbi:MAG: S-adenosylmethionine:tRNA ribosyltransferase-isomerase [Verrucomicrobiae bacterium]|nr:S-adenosylmethionine:tRNA ribosyltransferase-isomerase [Verrucomicrobiae bacterium]
MKTSDFDYELPAELIAQQPLADRAAARMLVVQRATGEIVHEQFRNIGRYLRPGDLLVLNDTKVIPARVWSEKPVVELLLVEDLGDRRWSALVKPGRRARVGTTLQFAGMTAVVEGETNFGGRVLRFTGDVEAWLERHGVPPLPPYIRRDRPDRQELPRYQTVFARQAGAVAAPTAGLHFTPELLAQFPHAFITLHVGIGTFRPVKVEDVEQHQMHSERFEIPAATKAAIARAQRVVAVGTTVVRALESTTTGRTEIFIRPPFEFIVVDALLTNFHLPKSTLLMLVSAFASRELILRAYAEAVRERYRFFSYGDCMLIL